MILIVTNREDYTADFLILELRRRAIEYVRFNTEDFPTRIGVDLQAENEHLIGRFIFSNIEIEFDGIDSVWYRRPVNPIPDTSIVDDTAFQFAAEESQETLDGIWNLLDCFWVSRPERIRQAESKLFQLKTAQQLGFNIPSTIVTNHPKKALEFYGKHKEGLIYKPIRHGYLKRDETISLVYTNRVTSAEASQLNNVRLSPSLLQEYIEKDVEIRATVVGDDVFAVELHSQECRDAMTDWRRGNVSHITHKPHRLEPDIERKCRDLVKRMGLEFGAIDLILKPSGDYVFIEINPNGQWAWVQQVLPEIPIRESLVNLLVGGRS